jgi:prevent-host-death family protein
MKRWSIQDAKNRFSEVVEAARRKPQTVTKHGTPVAVIIDVTEYERLRKVERARAPSFVDMLLAIPKGGEDFERVQVQPRDFEA